MGLFDKKPKENLNKKSNIKSINDYQWLALDIGTENFKARYVNIGLTYDAPTYLAEDYEKNVILYGEEAKALIDKTNENVVIKRPVRDGNIADPDALQRILAKIFQDFRLEIKDSKQADKNRNLIVLMATPSEINSVQREALENIVHRLGALRGFVQEEVKMAALGSGQDIFGTAIMCVDIGGGSTDIAVLSNDSILYSYTTHCAGDYLTQKIQEYIAKKHALKIGTKEAEDVKKNIGSLLKYQDEKPYTISGVSLPRLDSQPGETMSISKTIEITPEEIRENVMQVQFREHVIPSIRRVLRTSGEKAAGSVSDLKKKGKGITICGGGAYIKKIDEFIKEELAKEYFIEVKAEKATKPIRQKYEGDIFEVRVAQNPLDNVIDGCVKYRDTIYKQLIVEQNPNREILTKDEDLG
ncbi:rod shape-determining protein [Spiroplasma endosymbiont of Danaus chrysippus]|uniref:rod shape-determining protein n=1 Tax=Spiroplasma endosymbiont of Danaus chrysippus TaxID=2691041 RepID=UPI0013C75DB0|nr:rod shape-determining protein [Spiroplasma endosymbiont of Danaus chrysippus]CAB1054883.1 Rod shape-determining protein MreB [Spiroplasma endosymbiont of Danaus chrysippus]